MSDDQHSGGTVEVRDSYKDTLLGGQAQKESILSGVILMMTPLCAWQPLLFHKDTALIYGKLTSLSQLIRAQYLDGSGPMRGPHSDDQASVRLSALV